MIEKHYRKFITEDVGFGRRAIAQSENFREAVNEGEESQEIGWRPRRV